MFIDGNNLMPRTMSKTANLLDNFNRSLSSLKELFHRTGRFDDANVKIDEITKLLVIKFFDIQNNTNYLSLEYLENAASLEYKDKNLTARALQNVFYNVTQNKMFINTDGTNIFGANPHLNIQSTDNDFAKTIIETINSIDLISLNGNKTIDFDLLNEAFGHFVRDNFRNHKEDAQYMTPIEVVDTMTEMALTDILRDKTSKKRLFSDNPEDFIVLDPTCGVGSFLISVSKKISNIIKESKIASKTDLLKQRNQFSYIGQDKVDRMVRMSKLNYLFFGLNTDLIAQGNSITGDSFIDSYTGKVDLIITNPPFGAEFSCRELLETKDKYEVLPEFFSDIKDKMINSELIMLDRSLKLLRPGGRLLIIVPDSVISSRGIYEDYRKLLPEHAILKSVIDLPAVTFAQAGTRTRCSILYLQKPYTKSKIKQNGIFMAMASEIGFDVKEKLGSPVKIYNGENDLIKIVEQYKTLEPFKNTQTLLNNPSVVAFPFKSLINNKWNANFYNSARIKAVNNLDNILSEDFEIKPLKEIAQLCSKQRKKMPVSETTKCISVLHINEDSVINFDEVLKYNPAGSGNQCYPGEIMFSKINPRIPRVAVIPEVQFNLTCSSEFEIIKPFNDKYIYLLKTLLLTDIIQKQINALTSGTSSSHNRIKDTELANIKLPWPKENSPTEQQLLNLAEKIKAEELSKYNSTRNIKESFNSIEKIIGI